MAKKKAAFVVYALERRKQYEKNPRKKLSFPELLSCAKDDWTKESDDVKKYYKDLAKNDKPSTVAPRHETSSQRIDTEAAVVTNKSLGEKWEEKKQKKISKSCKLFHQSIGSIEELINRKFGIIDFSAHVEYMDGLTVPAEFGMVQGSLKTGLELKTDSGYNELILIEPLNKRHLRDGFRNDMKVNCEREHGIDIYTLKDKQAVEVETLCHEITRRVPDEMLILCRKEDVKRVLGAWYWIKYQLQYRLPRIQVVTLEYFTETVINHMIEKHDRGEYGSRISQHTLTDHFSKPFYDTHPALRCPFHQSEEGCDKKSCTQKNTTKYFYQLITVLADFFPEIDLAPDTHVFVPGKQAVRHNHNIPAPANTPCDQPLTPPSQSNPYINIQPETTPTLTPRRPDSYSARNKSPNSCSSSSNSTRSSSPVNDTCEDQLPRRPKSNNKNLANGKQVVKAKSSLTYDQVPVTYDVNNGARAVESPTGFSELSLNGRHSKVGRGRSRARNNTPSPPGVTPPTVGSVGVTPPTVGSVGVTPPTMGSAHPALGSAGGKYSSRGRGERMAAMLVSTRKTENVSAPDFTK